VSTDEIIPAWAAMNDDDLLGRYCYSGLRSGCVDVDSVRRGGFSVSVSGASKGCGSSREAAPYSELAAGIRLVIAPRFEKIYRQNAENIGLFTSTDFELLSRIRRGEPIPISELTLGLDALSASVVEHGGLSAYNRARRQGLVGASCIAANRKPRPMTTIEKILAAHAVIDSEGEGELEGGREAPPSSMAELEGGREAPPSSIPSGLDGDRVGVVAVQPGDAFFARTDFRFSHEYVTAMAEGLMRRGFGSNAAVRDPASVAAFQDHLVLLESVSPKAERPFGLEGLARGLATRQADFAGRAGVTLYGQVARDGRPPGAAGICHNKVIEDIALPGQLVVGTDSHTCTAGALGCLAFGIGSTDMANAWVTKDVRVTVPETVRCLLRGRLSFGVCAKDVALHLLAMPYFKAGHGVGKVLEFAGDAIASLPVDERATLTNMAVEAGAVTGIVDADAVVVEYLSARGVAPDEAKRMIVTADPGALYAATIELDLTEIVPMVATPGDPRSGIPVAKLGRAIPIDIAYGGSCTGGKCNDMDMYALVVRAALERGLRVHPRVRFYVQGGSQAVRRYAEKQGYLAMFEQVGAEYLEPACGACIRAGPGASTTSSEVTVSAQNRNFPGRSGPGKVYLASPWVVAASAIAGRIVPFEGAAGASQNS
jgi:3-isopropylmalate/(R)-2-methylmalate dehydratase large subunit